MNKGLALLSRASLPWRAACTQSSASLHCPLEDSFVSNHIVGRVVAIADCCRIVSYRIAIIDCGCIVNLFLSSSEADAASQLGALQLADGAWQIGSQVQTSLAFSSLACLFFSLSVDTCALGDILLRNVSVICIFSLSAVVDEGSSGRGVLSIP